MTMNMSEVDVDLSQVSTLGNRLLTQFDRLRERGPVHWSEASRCWIVTGHTEVMDGLSGKLSLSSHQFPAALAGIIAPQDQAERLPNTIRYISRFATNLDPPDHTRVRKLLVRAVNRKLVESVRPFVRTRVQELLDKLEKTPEIEFSENIARQLPGSVILRLLGMSDDYLDRLKGWADAFVLGLAAAQPKLEWLDDLERRVVEMLSVFAGEIEKRRDSPTQDLISALIEATEDGDKLSQDEMQGTLQQLIVAGHESTSSSMTLGLVALANYPDQWTYLRKNPDRAVQAANELMRFAAMSTAFARVVTKDFEWSGRYLRAGDRVFLAVAGGNRDPKVFRDPGILDFTRGNDQSLTFGPGLHHCVGHLLAKMQLSEFFGALVDRFDGVDITDESLHFMPQLAFRGLHELRVRFHPRR
jgi:pimeloyl-[acyl-carrier protein] synthase